jgi:hypothetical protein
MQCACTIFSSVTCRSLQYFSTLSHLDMIYEKGLLDIKCVLCSSLNLSFEKFLTLRTERDTMKNIQQVFM